MCGIARFSSPVMSGSVVHMASTASAKWPGYAVALWGIFFAVPSFVWALGGTLGAQTTVAPDLVQLVQDGATWFIVVLWVTGFLKLLAGLIGFGLTRPWGRSMGRLLVLCGWGAAVLLVFHGVLFVVQGLLVQVGVLDIDPELRGVSRWYLYLWGPWFIAGGVAFAAAARRYVGRSIDRRGGVVAGLLGAAGGLLVSIASVLTGIG